MFEYGNLIVTHLSIINVRLTLHYIGATHNLFTQYIHNKLVGHVSFNMSRLYVPGRTYFYIALH